MDDILHVLMWVDVVEVQEDSEYQDWKCKVEGVDTDGNELVLLSAIDKNERSVLCMTVFDEKRGGHEMSKLQKGDDL